MYAEIEDIGLMSDCWVCVWHLGSIEETMILEELGIHAEVDEVSS